MDMLIWWPIRGHWGYFLKLFKQFFVLPNSIWQFCNGILKLKFLHLFGHFDGICFPHRTRRIFCFGKTEVIVNFPWSGSPHGIPLWEEFIMKRAEPHGVTSIWVHFIIEIETRLQKLYLGKDAKQAFKPSTLLSMLPVKWHKKNIITN